MKTPVSDSTETMTENHSSYYRDTYEGKRLRLHNDIESKRDRIDRSEGDGSTPLKPRNEDVPNDSGYGLIDPQNRGWSKRT